MQTSGSLKNVCFYSFEFSSWFSLNSRIKWRIAPFIQLMFIVWRTKRKHSKHAYEKSSILKRPSDYAIVLSKLGRQLFENVDPVSYLNKVH